ncbi:Phosphatidylethanolamine N-methyltransferase Short=PEAMT [Rhizoctonia solani AG-1 IB]|uniref:Phosphatidylethanolamine N-methyltransferase Short=PEAMT n=1 Tax=Thanatephorus cucumeris (strain AG1-IB / isolate 7/3/14) TaxID=1108050 RepID=M5C5C3_THACB|nr:Phosphatidylethanolamine N-methyltransferase Short=PEAMT [Rhizoctonia solani AG-1 IB]
MGSDYSFDELPVEYNTWLLFRQVVDIILINDFLSYCMFAFTVFRIPDDIGLSTHALRWLITVGTGETYSLSEADLSHVRRPILTAQYSTLRSSSMASLKWHHTRCTQLDMLDITD